MKDFSIGLSDLYNINGKSSFPMEERLANSRTPFTAGVVSRKSIQLPKNLILSWSVVQFQRKRNQLVTGLEGRRNVIGGEELPFLGARTRNALSVKAAGAKSSRPTIVKSVNYEWMYVCMCVRVCVCTWNVTRDRRSVRLESKVRRNTGRNTVATDDPERPNGFRPLRPIVACKKRDKFLAGKTVLLSSSFFNNTPSLYYRNYSEKAANSEFQQ